MVARGVCHFIDGDARCRAGWPWRVTFVIVSGGGGRVAERAHENSFELRALLSCHMHGASGSAGPT
eukprot:7078636-Prymnesium_polylepis.1